MLNQKELAPFILSAIISAVAMLLADYNFFNLIPGSDSEGVNPLKFLILVPGIAFSIPILIHYKSYFKNRDYLILPSLLLLLWLFAFGISFNVMVVFTVPLAGLIGAFCIWWLLYERYGIRFKRKNWQIGLVGAGSAAIAYWLANVGGTYFMNQQVLTELTFFPVMGAFIVFAWQLAVGYAILEEKKEDEYLDKINEIGNID